MPMLGRNPCGRLVLAACAGGVITAVVAACASDGADQAPVKSMSSVFSGRPRVAVSVAEAHPGTGVDQLDFFDDLEKRDLVSHDDALHASLLLFAGQSGQTFVQRAGRAKQMGLLDPRFDRLPREAITVGELSLIVAAGMHRAGAGSETRAMADLVAQGILPDFAQENSGVSGAQLLTIIGHAEDAIATATTRPTTPRADALDPFTPEERRLAAASVLRTQPAGGEKKPTKKPPIDLDKEAKRPRPGQVLPEGTPATPEPAPTPETSPAPSTPPPTPSTPSPATPAPKPAPIPSPKPLPPPRAEGGVPSRVDGIASDLRYVAVDRVNAEATEVLGPGEMVQWRVVDDGRGHPGEWQTMKPGAPINDRIEVRTGMGVRVSIRVSDSANIVLHRLSRARIERKIRSDGMSQLGVTIYRGMVEASGLNADVSDSSRAPIYVKTPDQVFPLRTRALFEYDAFRGTIAREFMP